MINAVMLNEKVHASNLTVTKLAKAIGMHRRTYYKKLKGERYFVLGEIWEIRKALNLTKEDVYNIFIT